MKPRTVSTALVLLVAALVGAAGITATLGSPPAVADAQEETPTPTPTPEPPGTATFDEDVYLVAPDDPVEMVISFEEVDRATVRVGDETTDYDANVTVVDADGDGTVNLTFDTSAVGGDGEPFSVEGEDELTVEDELSVEDPETALVNVPLSASVEGIQTGAATILVREEDPDTPGTPTDDGTPDDGTPDDGTPTEDDGTPDDGTPTEDGTPEDGMDDGTPTDGEDTPGFGLIAALVAVLAAAVVALRR
jgi:PGF-CTERM protein